MPKKEIDYSNTIIYKITCSDPKITDVYVGYTTNFVQRKHAHKQGCNNNKNINYKCKLYEVIRNNGGWQNWKMEIINFFNCRDHYEARQKEHEYYISLNATLNIIEPMPKPKPKELFIKNKIINEEDNLFCNKCKFNCDIHTKTQQHLKQLDISADALTLNSPNVSKKFTCALCDYKCSKESDYNKHLSTRKHKTASLRLQNAPEKSPKMYKCLACNKEYVFRQSLHNHKKKCIPIKPVSTLYIKEAASASTISHTSGFAFTNDSELSTEPAIGADPASLTLLVIDLLKSNQELQKQMLEVCKNSNSTINSNNHSNNKTFNMQFFLNEHCKDAMNIMDFVNTFQLDYSDLEKVGEVGYVEGISNIIIQKLNEMDVYKRPIHCSDEKRETMFVKDKNVWEKENGNRDKLRLAIKHITKKNTDMLLSWCNAHPGSCDSDNYLNDIYIEMVRQAMGGRGNIEDNENKIMRKIARSVLIDKSAF